MPSGKPGSSLTSRYRFPHAGKADSDGFLAAGGDLAPGTLLLAYRNGIFPWTTHPITWWSPDPRAIIPLDGVHVSRSLRKTMKRGAFRVSFDQAFRAVMEGCARRRPRRKETWISPQFITAYCQLHEIGHAHSVEIWNGERLVGGLYGVSIGGFFAGESMFSDMTDASKVALVSMAEKLAASGFALFDVQMMTPHLQSMGAVEIPREEYLRRLAAATEMEVSFSEVDSTERRSRS
ncbi:MAG TPA: leucyl/phenylalanyl-tRNA--protein transferase [Spirochaetia bacterium]|nr:leucyl/phenylalanyl-tRNA--protein transferase [Spirochaetia bacterium]